MAKKKTEPTADNNELPKRRKTANGTIKSWAVTWLLAIFAAEWGLLPQPLKNMGNFPFWIPIGMDILRFLVLWFCAFIITRITFAAWEIIRDY